MVFLFSSMVVVFLMNLLIGALNIAIEADNDRASYSAQKAEVSKKYNWFNILGHPINIINNSF